jgi:glycosyltransferase involved in cell wall biosynthesis
MQVVLSLVPGGAERLALDIARRIRTVAESAVCCLDQPGPWAEEAAMSGIPVTALHRRPGLSPAIAFRLGAEARSFGADIVHCHQYSPFVYGALAALFRPPFKLVVTEHGRLSDAPPSPRRRLANPLLSRIPDAFFAVSNELRDYLVTAGCAASSVQVNRNGIAVGPRPLPSARASARAALGVPDDAFLLGTMGRLDPVKDLETLLGALRILRERVPGAALAIVGDGPERTVLVERIATLGLTAVVHVTGYRADARALLPAFDAFVNTSVSEGISLTLLEAMAAALPVVATRVGGTPEVVVDGLTGILVSPRDPMAVASACEALAGAPAARARLGERGRRRVEREFDVEAMVDRYVQTYRRLSGKCGS